MRNIYIYCRLLEILSIDCFVICLFNDTATTGIYTYSHTLSLHDALPILLVPSSVVTTEMPTDPPTLRSRLSRLAPSVRHVGPSVAKAMVLSGMKIKIGRAHV